MQTVSNRGVSPNHPWMASRPARALPNAVAAPKGGGLDEQFLQLLQGFRRSGGVARGRDLVSPFDGGVGMNVGLLARWMVEGQVIHFDWQQETWLPVFQFDATEQAPRAAVGRVLNEFSGVLDAWEIALWFARPSSDLSGQAPADAIVAEPDAVLHLARCDRFVIKG